jgi:hypothetical protein
VDRSLRVLWAASLATLVLGACSLDAEGVYQNSGVDSGHDATMQPDVAVAREASDPDTGGGPSDGAHGDSPSQEASSPDGETLDSGSDAPEAEAGFDASNIAYECPHDGTEVADCADCKNHPLACVYCEGHLLVGECLHKGKHCEQHVLDGATMCPCDGNDAEACVLGDQVCLGPDAGCGTCGQGGSDNLSCRDGGSCHESSNECRM